MTYPVVPTLQFDKLKIISFHPNQYYEDSSSICIWDYGEWEACLSIDIPSARLILLLMDIFQNHYIDHKQDGRMCPLK